MPQLADSVHVAHFSFVFRPALWAAVVATPGPVAVQMLAVLALVNVKLSSEERTTICRAAIRAFVEFSHSDSSYLVLARPRWENEQ